MSHELSGRLETISQTRPIAGTYPRGHDEEADRRQAVALLEDPKERAEHVMLVDLGRNDLGRVCEYGTVAVDEYMVVETYSHVLHIVSQVSGTLRPELGAMDALRAVLPAGTLSGAPKVRAMQIIDELEPHKRCSYGGAVGYLGFSGDLDTAIHIRTVVVKDGVAHVQAGGGTFSGWGLRITHAPLVPTIVAKKQPLGKSLRFMATCNADCALTTGGDTKAKTEQLNQGNTEALKAKLKAKARDRLEEKGKAKLKVTVDDGYGDVVTETVKVKLKR